MFSNSRMRVCKRDGYTLVLGRNDRVELAERDLCSVLVFGASVNATVLGIRRMVSAAVRGVSSRGDEGPRWTLDRVRMKTGSFARVVFSSQTVRDSLLAELRRQCSVAGWHAIEGRPLAERRLLREQRRMAHGIGAAASERKAHGIGARLRPRQRKWRRCSSGSLLNALRIGTLNVNGIHARAKLQELSERGQQLNLDMIGVTETHLTGTSGVKVPGYRWMGVNGARQVEYGHASGGVGVLISDAIYPMVERVKNTDLSQSENDFKDQIWLRVRGEAGGMDMYLGVVYMPVASSAAVVRKTAYGDLSKGLALLRTKGDVVVVGDFNARAGPRAARLGNSPDSGVNDNGVLLEELVRDHDMVSAAECARRSKTGFTYRRRNGGLDELESVLDYAVVCPAVASRTTRYEVDSVELDSDHSLVWMEMNVKTPKRPRPNQRQKVWRMARLEQPAVAQAYADSVDRGMASLEDGEAGSNQSVEELWAKASMRPTAASWDTRCWGGDSQSRGCLTRSRKRSWKGGLPMASTKRKGTLRGDHLWQREKESKSW